MTDFNPNGPDFDPSTLPDDLVPPSEQRLSPRQRSHVLAPLDAQVAAPPARGRGAIWAPVLVAAALVVALVIGYQVLGPGQQAGPGATGAPTLSAASTASSQAASQSPTPSPSDTPEEWPPTDFPPRVDLTNRELASACLEALSMLDSDSDSGSDYQVVSTSPDGFQVVAANDTKYSVCDGFQVQDRATSLNPMALTLSPTDPRQFHWSRDFLTSEFAPKVPPGDLWTHMFAGGNAKGIKSVTYEFSLTSGGKTDTTVTKAAIANGYWTMGTVLKTPDSDDPTYSVKITVVTTAGKTIVFSYTNEQIRENYAVECRHWNHGC